MYCVLLVSDILYGFCQARVAYSNNTSCIGLTYNQLNNNLVSQAAEMSTHGVPNDVLSNLDPITLVILIPLFDVLVCYLPCADVLK